MAVDDLAFFVTKRTDFDNIRQDVDQVKKYASDFQTFIGVNEMMSVVDGEVKKQKGAFNYDLFELKIGIGIFCERCFCSANYKFPIR
jgi:hypothetical protein